MSRTKHSSVTGDTPPTITDTSDAVVESTTTTTTTNPPKTLAERRHDANENLLETSNLLVMLAVCLRCIVSLYPYSGHARPPMYGDFEAQRHWQEVTVNLPPAQWYENGTDNDLQYWGLDYPPLTAYHSWSMGWLARQLNASYVTLHASRGITTEPHKTFMRSTVLAADVLVYLPAMWLVARACAQLTATSRRSGPPAVVEDHGRRLVHFAVLVLFPGQMLIDSGHFQYNNISLGLSAIAVAALLHGQLLAGCAAFALALNYKQMELYHALPVFVYLLRKCVPVNGGGGGALAWCAQFVWNVAAKGAVVLGVFVALWWPWLRSLSASAQVLHRIFPVARGVFEDKVANVWCVLNVAVPLKELVANGPMAVICVALTLLAAAPSLGSLWLRPGRKALLLALINTSLAFFLLSFQVHEKTILLAALPIAMYLPFDPLPCLIFLQTATFSMLPLLRQDQLLEAYAYITLLYLAALRIVADTQLRRGAQSLHYWWDVLLVGRLFVYERDGRGVTDVLRRIVASGGQTDGTGRDGTLAWRHTMMAVFYATLGLQGGMFYVLAYVEPPAHLPDLFPLLIAGISAVYFGVFFVYFTVKQCLLDESEEEEDGKTHME